MADRLILRKALLTAAVLSCLCGLPVAAAETLPDPTRPPAGFVDSVTKGGLASSSAEPSPASDVQEKATPGPHLQSVILPKRGRPIAIISGKYVPLGERYAGMELVSVGEQEVVLVSGSERRILRLTPEARKSTPDGKPASGRNREAPQGGQRGNSGIGGRGQ